MDEWEHLLADWLLGRTRAAAPLEQVKTTYAPAQAEQQKGLLEQGPDRAAMMQAIENWRRQNGR